MTVEVIETDGLGMEARVRVDGVELVVMDDFTFLPSDAIDLEHPEFGYLEDDSRDSTWEAMFSGNPQREKRLKRLQGWEYDGFGQVVSIKPVVVDFGVLELEIGDFTNDERCVGQWIKVPIARLDLTFRTRA